MKPGLTVIPWTIHKVRTTRYLPPFPPHFHVRKSICMGNIFKLCEPHTVGQPYFVNGSLFESLESMLRIYLKCCIVATNVLHCKIKNSRHILHYVRPFNWGDFLTCFSWLGARGNHGIYLVLSILTFFNFKLIRKLITRKNCFHALGVFDVIFQCYV